MTTYSAATHFTTWPSTTPVPCSEAAGYTAPRSTGPYRPWPSASKTIAWTSTSRPRPSPRTKFHGLVSSRSTSRYPSASSRRRRVGTSFCWTTRSTSRCSRVWAPSNASTAQPPSSQTGTPCCSSRCTSRTTSSDLIPRPYRRRRPSTGDAAARTGSRAVAPLPRRGDGGNGVAHDPRGGDGGESRGIPGRHELHEVEADEASLLGQATEQLDDVPVEEPAGRRCEHGGHDGRVQAVAIDGHQAAGVRVHQVEDGRDPMAMNLEGRDDPRAPRTGVANVRGASAADPAQAHLHDAANPRHLRGAPHGAAVAVFLAADLVAPVEVGVDLHDGQRPPALERPEHRDRHGVVTAEHDRDDVPVQQRAHRRRDRLPIAAGIGRIARQIAAIDGRVRAHAAEVEVVLLAEPGVASQRRP